MMRTLVLNRPVIAVTGSAGKTTTKEMIGSILERRWKIFKSKGNQNSLVSSARHAKQIQMSHRAVVLEFGMERLGHIRRHCQYIQPNFGVITNVGTAHIGNFNGQIEGVAQAKSELIQYMKQTGKLLINADDQNSALLNKKGFQGIIKTVGIANPANYRAKQIRYDKKGMNFQVELDGTDQSFYIPIYGMHNIYNALFAIAVSHQLGFTAAEMKLGLQSFSRQARRLFVYRLQRGIRILDDSYSANPQAMKAAIDVLASLAKRTKIAVFGDMLELGKYSVKGHREVGRYLAGKKIDYLYTYGNKAKEIGKGAIESGFPRDKVIQCLNRNSLHQQLVKQMRPYTTFLIKGSNQTQMNKTVQFLLSNNQNKFRRKEL